MESNEKNKKIKRNIDLSLKTILVIKKSNFERKKNPSNDIREFHQSQSEKSKLNKKTKKNKGAQRDKLTMSNNFIGGNSALSKNSTDGLLNLLQLSLLGNNGSVNATTASVPVANMNNRLVFQIKKHFRSFPFSSISNFKFILFK